MTQKKVFSQKNQRLVEIAVQLKNEFIGIDEIIDQLIYAVKPWYLAPELQESPLVINLWGMTGVGKTSLVERFIALALEDELVPCVTFNLGDKSFAEDVLDRLEYLEKTKDERAVLIFDEFQHAKTLKEDSTELDKPFSRLVWSILDEGNFYFMPLKYERPYIHEWLNGLEICLKRGVKIEGGKVVDKADVYSQIMGFERRDLYIPIELSTEKPIKNPDLNFFNENQISDIAELSREKFKFKSDLRAFLSTIDGPQLRDFLENLSLVTVGSQKVNLTKSLIFILGNLDAAYDMSYSMSSEDNADQYHEESKKVGFNEIKDVLKTKFRLEEIARLGNIHLIYPALSGDVFRQYIQKQLTHIQHKYESKFNLKLSFEPSLSNMLYEEGVIPAQGLRPLKSSIRYLLEPALLEMLGSLVTERQEINIRVLGDQFEAISAGEKIFSKELHLPIRKAKNRSQNADLKSVIAVHEAGHALAYMLYFGKFPKKITIKTADAASGGFVKIDKFSEVHSLAKLRADVKVRLAGKIAEELVFGADCVSDGSSSDLYMATKYLMVGASDCGFAKRNVSMEHFYKGNGELMPIDQEVNLWVMKEMEDATNEVKQTLQDFSWALSIIIKNLVQLEEINQEEIKKIFIENEVNLNDLFQHKNLYIPYQEKLENFLNK
jgi:cell division protease FtsH